VAATPSYGRPTASHARSPRSGALGEPREDHDRSQSDRLHGGELVRVARRRRNRISIRRAIARARRGVTLGRGIHRSRRARGAEAALPPGVRRRSIYPRKRPTRGSLAWDRSSAAGRSPLGTKLTISKSNRHSATACARRPDVPLDEDACASSTSPPHDDARSRAASSTTRSARRGDPGKRAVPNSLYWSGAPFFGSASAPLRSRSRPMAAASAATNPRGGSSPPTIARAGSAGPRDSFARCTPREMAADRACWASDERPGMAGFRADLADSLAPTASPSAVPDGCPTLSASDGR